jgi:WD40 repeat protein
MLTSTARIQGLDISHDDRYLASAGYDGKVRVWDLRHDVEKIDCGGDMPLAHGVLSHDAHWLAVVDTEYKTTIWNCRENHLESSRPMLEPLKFSPSGKFLITRNKLTAQLALVHVPNLQPVETLGDLQGVIEMTVSADDRTVALLAADRSVRIVDLKNSHDKRQLRLSTDGPIEGLHIAVSPDGNQLVWLEQGQLAQYAVNVTTGEREPLPESLGFMSLAMTDSGASLDPSGRHVILTAKNSGDLNCQETITGRALDPWRHPEKLIANCAWSPDGSRVVVSTKNGTPVVIDPVTGEQLCELDTALEPIRSNLIFSPNADELIAFTTDGVSTRGYLYRWRAPRD